jgi:signal transduction histidine kinase
MLKSLLVLLSVLVTISVSGQDSCWDCNVDSLRAELKKKTTVNEQLQVLQLIVDLQGISINNYSYEISPLDNLLYVEQLLALNRQAKLFDSAPYRNIRDALISYNNMQYHACLESLKHAVNLFDKEKKIIVVLLANIRNIYNLLNKQEERFSFYQNKLQYYLVNGPVENTAACYHGMAGYYFNAGEFNIAITHFFKAAETYKPFYYTWYVTDLAVIGDTYAYWGNDEKASYYLNKALPLIKAVKNKIVISFTLSSLFKVAYKQENYADALLYADETIRIWEKENDKQYSYAIALYQKALAYIAMQNHTKALSYLTEAKRYEEMLPDKLTNLYGELEIDYAYYLYYKLKNNTTAAERNLLNAYKLAVEEESGNLQLKYLRELFHFYKERKSYHLAQQYANLYFKLHDALEQKQQAFKIAHYEYEQKQAEQASSIAELKQQSAVQKVKLGQRNKIIWISSITFSIVLLSLILLYRQLKINKKTLAALKETQAQIIFKEKMASLGELTAGIAHEIQNPLNFVNNFSEVSAELIQELKQENGAGRSKEVEEVANEIEENIKKITNHGKRADLIVKSMLEHSRSSNGESQVMDINALVEEYLRLSYHGFRGKDKSFNAILQTDFDKSIESVNVVPQDIGRVLLNLLNNAYYAVHEKKKQQGEGYEPTVFVSTKKLSDTIEITVKDNGMGISKSLQEKIFQPFFTTKPTGEGTGLGLSLSYDIVKAHGGELKVESTEGEGAEFIMTLPQNSIS